MITRAGEYTIDYITVEHDSKIKSIGVVADTHIPARGHFIPPELFRIFSDVELILHAGDLVEEAVLEEFAVLAPVEAVAGNMDPHKLTQSLGRLKLIKIGRVAIGLLHGDIEGRKVDFKQVSKLFAPETVNAIVFGHLHEPVNKKQEGILFFNPGSAVDPRRMPRPSCGRLEIRDTEISGEIFYF